MAASMSRLVANLEFHWIRHHRKKRRRRGKRKKNWYICWSKELISFQLGTIDSNSPLAMFRGFENSVLRTIADFTGYDIIQPCSCCQGGPLAFCCTQFKKFVMFDPKTLPTTTDSQNQEEELPLKAYIDNHFYSNLITMRKETSSDKTIDKESRDRLMASRENFYFLPGCYDTVVGTGAFACTDEGIFSSLVNISWKQIVEIGYKVWVETCRSKSASRGKKQEFELIFKKESSKKYSNNDRDLLISGMYVDTEKIVFKLPNKDLIYWIIKMIQKHKNEYKKCN